MSAQNAVKGGADRIELCQNLEVGGVTPAMEGVDYCVNTLGVRTHVLVRPRGGDFCYSSDEVAQIKADVLACKQIGAHAVVVGFLTQEGYVDKDLTRQIVALAAPMEVTFHRAFDEMSQDPFEALEVIISTGCKRILTSGCRPTALAGADTIKNLVLQSKGRIEILAGSGIAPENVAEIISRTGVQEVHGSCKCTLSDGTTVTDQRIVSQLVNIAKNRI